VRLGFAALNPQTLHPVEIAGQAAALDLASNGRAYVGIVSGAWLEQLGLDEEKPLTRLREAVEVVRRLLAGDRSGFAGERFALAPGAGLAYEPLRPSMPLLIGTWRPRAAAFAREVADEVKIGGTANPDMVRLMRGWLGGDGSKLQAATKSPGAERSKLQAATKSAGERSKLQAATKSPRIVVGAVTVVDEDGDRAREHARAQVQMYLDVVAELDPTLEPGDAPLEKFVLAGTPEEVAEHARALYDAGAHRVEFGTPQGLTTRGGVELLCTRVLPLLRR
jgi:5,10-methylenetetrahydromethanopterin reductase